MRIVLTGGTGFVGQELLQALLAEKHQVTLLTRNARKAGLSNTLLKVMYWDAKSPGDWQRELDGADAVIHLAGESIANKRWTRSQKEILTRSRLDSTRAIVNAIAIAVKKPAVLISASAIGYYGDVESGDVLESHSKGVGFLADLCQMWELEALAAEQSGARVVLLRIGVVLGKGGGALKKMTPPFQMYVGGPIGSGRQWFSWIHREDLVKSVLFALKNANVKGPVNATAPKPLTQREFSSALGRALGKPSWAPVPAFILKLGLGEMSDMLVTGQKVVPDQLTRTGFAFKFPDADSALADIFRKPV